MLASVWTQERFQVQDSPLPVLIARFFAAHLLSCAGQTFVKAQVHLDTFSPESSSDL